MKRPLFLLFAIAALLLVSGLAFQPAEPPRDLSREAMAAVKFDDQNGDTLDFFDDAGELLYRTPVSGFHVGSARAKDGSIFFTHPREKSVLMVHPNRLKSEIILKTKHARPDEVIAFDSEGMPFLMVISDAHRLNDQTGRYDTNAVLEIYDLSSRKLEKTIDLDRGTDYMWAYSTSGTEIQLMAVLLGGEPHYRTYLYVFDKQTRRIAKQYDFRTDFGSGRAIVRLGGELWMSSIYKEEGDRYGDDANLSHEIYAYGLQDLRMRRRRDYSPWMINRMVATSQPDRMVAFLRTATNHKPFKPRAALAFIDTKTMDILKLIEMPSAERIAALAPNGDVWVSTHYKKLLILDPKAMTIRKEIPGDYAHLPEFRP